jgi:PmbA protein
MLNRDHATDIFSKLKSYSSADEIEVLLYATKNALTRFANNVIHQNMAEENVVVSVRTAFGQRTARATTNKLDEDSLRRVVQASERLAKVQQPDADLLPIQASTQTEAGGGARLTRFFECTAAVTPEQRAETVRRIVAVAEKNKLTTAGIYSNSETAEGVFNSRGLAQWHTQTSSEISITMLGADASGWQKANSPSVTSLEPLALAETAARKARESAQPREVAPGKYTVILEPAAVLDMVGFMFYDFGGMAVLDQRSFLNDRVGTRVFGENINIWDDVAHPLQ